MSSFFSVTFFLQNSVIAFRMSSCSNYSCVVFFYSAFSGTASAAEDAANNTDKSEPNPGSARLRSAYLRTIEGR